jgi:hypothetical protein
MIIRQPVFISLLILFFGLQVASGQKKEKDELRDRNFVSFGLEVSPIIPTGLFNRSLSRVENQSEQLTFSLDPLLSYRFGGALRFDVFNFRRLKFGNMFTFNTGIYYNRRAFRVEVRDVSNPVEDQLLISDRFRYISYEIPLMLQLHLQASQTIWVNFALGTGAEFYPSQVYTKQGESGKEGFFLQYTARKFLILAPLKASFGAEYRTEKSGYFGLGVSISRPMPYMADTYLEYWKNSGQETYAVYPYGSKADENLPVRNQGMFLSVDFRYYFQPSRHEREKVPSYIRDRQKNKNRN